MNVNPQLLRSAKEEWSDWLERPDQPEPLSNAELEQAKRALVQRI